MCCGKGEADDSGVKVDDGLWQEEENGSASWCRRHAAGKADRRQQETDHEAAGDQIQSAHLVLLFPHLTSHTCQQQSFPYNPVQLCLVFQFTVWCPKPDYW